WRLLGLGFQEPHRFAYAFDSENGPARSRFRARAHGDLDGDGQQSTFEISGEVSEGGLPVTHPEESYREVE
ncbi:MAG: hypothetical protein FJ104_11520, partial [Deltaproteobacteria bacterium]|nr:hypothetical protein [Deltaproteobacteria bacterium]